MRLRSAISNSPSADAITTAASAVCGRFLSSDGATSSKTLTATAPTTPVSCVLAPAASATGVRDELLLMGKPWKNAAARFAMPSAAISWFGSTGVFSFAA